jgi:hypothetical protein
VTPLEVALAAGAVNGLLPGEADAIKSAIANAERFGYGRLIQVLQQAWSAKCQAEGFDARTSDRAAGIICAWCKTDRRTGRRIEP